MEEVAVLDTIGVDPAFRGRGVGAALLEQLVRNLRGLNIDTVRTEVDWEGFDLLGFLARQGFKPAPRLCLDLDVAAFRSREERRAEEI